MNQARIRDAKILNHRSWNASVFALGKTHALSLEGLINLAFFPSLEEDKWRCETVVNATELTMGLSKIRASAMTLLGELAITEERWREAQLRLFLALDLANFVYGRTHQKTLMLQHKMANLHWMLGQEDEAIKVALNHQEYGGCTWRPVTSPFCSGGKKSISLESCAAS